MPVTHYLTPGLKKKSQVAAGLGRGLFRASNGNLYGVVGNRLYYIDQNWGMNLLGQLSTIGPSMVSMVDNGTNLLVVDGSANAKQVILATNTFSALVDSSGTFLGADKVDFLDTFTLFNFPQSQAFGCTRPSSTANGAFLFDNLYQASKTDWPDPLVTLAVVHREIWLLGQLTSEVWFDAGNPLFPFAETPGAFIEHGIYAIYSLAAADLSLFWLSQDKQGKGMVLRGNNYAAKRISTHAIEHLIRKLPRIDDAVGFTYQQEGHLFYVLQFPTGNLTLVFDDATQMWHQRQSGLDRWRVNSMAFAYGENVGLDYANGKLYTVDLETYLDDTDPIIRLRSFPHIINDLKRLSYKSFTADMEVGEGVYTKDARGVAIPPKVSLRWSDTRGKSWGNPVEQSLGAVGEYQTIVNWNRLGMARDRVFELSWSVPAMTALNGAYIETEQAET